MHSYQTDMAKLLQTTKAFRSGEFTLKSGAKSPYFINFGCLSDGAALQQLGQIFAACLKNTIGLQAFDVIVGPAYKGIGLAAATVMALQSQYQVSKELRFNRKESKAHGADVGSLWVGGAIADGARVVVIDDVFTTGATKVEIIEAIRQLNPSAKVVALLVGVDRQEPASQGGENFHHFCQQHQLQALAVLTIEQLVQQLVQWQSLDSQQAAKVRAYISTGATA